MWRTTHCTITALAVCLLIVAFAMRLGLQNNTPFHASQLVAAEVAFLHSDGNRNKPGIHSGEHYHTEPGAVRRWQSPIVHISILNEDKGRSVAQTRALVERSAELWNDKVGRVVQLMVADQPDREITVRFVPAEELPANIVGKTTTTYRLISQTLASAEILVQEGLGEEVALQTITHELGHALGIRGHSPNPTDMMYEKAHLPVEVTQRDANTLAAGYRISTSL